MHRTSMSAGVSIALALAFVVGACGVPPAASSLPTSGARVSPSPTSTARPSPRQTPAPRPTPTPIQDAMGPPLPPAILAANTTPHPVKAISVGFGICVIRDDGTLGCWGYDTADPPEGRYVAIDAGYGGTCAIREDGGVSCWDDETWSDAPWRVPSGAFQVVSVGHDHACGLRRDDGSIVCWPSPLAEEEMAYEDPDEEGAPASPDPASLPPTGSLVDIGVGESQDCALRADGTVACWAAWPEDMVTPDGRYRSLADGCAVRIDGVIECFGAFEGLMNESGLRPPRQGGYVDVSAVPSEDRGCGMRADGTLRCWGDEGYADEYAAEIALPMRTPAGVYTAVSVSGSSACALRADGFAVCWGYDDDDVRPAPATRLDLPLFVKSTTFPVRWRARPAFAPVVAYDVERGLGWDDEGNIAAWDPWYTATTKRSARFKGTPGEDYCWRVRAHDADGRISDWVGACTWVPHDDTAFKRSSGWATVRDSRYYFGRAVTTTKRGATLTIDVETFGLALFATTCPNCGTFTIGHERGDGEPVTLQSKKVHDKRVVWYGDNGEEGYWSSEGDASGHIVITVTSSGKPVTIDALLQGPSLNEEWGWEP